MSQIYSKAEAEQKVRPLNLQEDRTATNKQAIPYPVVWGTHRRSGVWLDQIFNAGNRTLTTEVATGKNSTEDVETGVEYFGSLALLVSFGRLHRILKILKNDAVVWESEEGSQSKNLESFRQIQIDGEVADMILYEGNFGDPRGGGERDSGLPEGHPSYKGFIWFTFDLSEFGTSPTPPNFEIIYETLNLKLVLDPENETGDPYNDDPEFHRDSGGQLIPEIIIDALTNPLYGNQMSISDFDLPSWVEACRVHKNEGLGYSPKLDSKTTTDSWVKGLLNASNSEIVLRNGQWAFKTIRSTDPVKIIPETSFLQDPEVTPSSFYSNSVANEVRIPFSTIEDDLEERSITAHDDVSQEIAGIRSKSYSYDGFRTEQAAERVASRLAYSLGSPVVKVKLSLDRSMIGIEKGDLLQPFYPETGLDGRQLIRVRSVTESGSSGGGIEITGIFDKGNFDNVQTGLVDNLDSTVPELVPSDLSVRALPIPDTQLQGFQDGFLMAISRSEITDDGAVVNFGWDGSSYDILAGTRSFQLEVIIHNWRDFGEGLANIEIEFPQVNDENVFLSSISDNLPAWQILTQTSSEEIETSWSSIRSGSGFQALGGGRYIISVQSGSFGTPEWVQGQMSPRRVAYLAPMESFLFHRTNSRSIFDSGLNGVGDINETRRFVVQSSTQGKIQPFEEAATFDYTRTTETLNRDWGDPSEHAFNFGIISLGVSGTAPLLTQIDINGTEEGSVTIDWGDGSPIEDFGTLQMMVSLTHNYMDAGSYVALLSVVPSSGGLTQTFEVEVEVSHQVTLGS